MTTSSKSGMKKLCVFIECSLRENAVPKHFKALAEALAERGHTAVILTTEKQGSLEDRDANPVTIAWPSERPVHLRDALFLKRLIEEYSPDILIANFGAENLFATVGCLKRVPIRVLWYRTLSQQSDIDYRERPLLSRIKRRLFEIRKALVYRFATHIASNSKATRADLRKRFLLPRRKCPVFYNTIPDPFVKYKLKHVNRDPNQIVCVARLVRSKGQNVLIQAIHKVVKEHPTVKVVFLGSGPLEAEYKNLAGTLGIAASCHFVGRVSNEEVYRYMQASAIKVLPSLSEAFGWVNIEAMAVGTPVIASAVGGIPEIVREGVDGFLVPPGDPRVLSEQILRLLKDNDLRESMGVNARTRFLKEFESNDMINRQIEWLERLERTR